MDKKILTKNDKKEKTISFKVKYDLKLGKAKEPQFVIIDATSEEEAYIVFNEWAEKNDIEFKESSLEVTYANSQYAMLHSEKHLNYHVAKKANRHAKGYKKNLDYQRKKLEKNIKNREWSFKHMEKAAKKEEEKKKRREARQVTASVNGEK